MTLATHFTLKKDVAESPNMVKFAKSQCFMLGKFVPLPPPQHWEGGGHIIVGGGGGIGVDGMALDGVAWQEVDT